MDSLPVALEQATSPLFALPLELQLEIISLLTHDEYPSLACLRRTHSYFLALIPKAQIRSGLSHTELCSQLLKTELEYGYLLPPKHYPCYFCARVLPLKALTGTFVWDRPHIVDYERRGDLGSRSSNDCCGLEDGSYTTSLKESLLWMGSTLRDLPWPPLAPRLISNDETKAVSVSKEVEQQNSQDAHVHGSGFTGHEEIMNPESILELTGNVIFRRTRSRLILWIPLSPQFIVGSPGVVIGDLNDA